MFKQGSFWEGILWLIVTAIATYGGLCVMTGYNVFLYGAWAGLAFANATIRFGKAYMKNKEEKSNE